MLELIDTGIRSIRSVTNDLRPSLLDDLGLLPALRSLVADFGERSGIPASFAAPATLPALSKEAELALFRALQEALSNVARHADARARGGRASRSTRRGLLLRVRDDGRGPPDGAAGAARAGRATWGSPGCGSGSARSAAACASPARGGAGALLEVLVPVAAGTSP